ncbi:unnamed protein product [Rhizophagus irregularis]|uniref:Galactose oxidase n=1 Tax=Rhizophagus irregularis TaxID=588596 RepID=A0A2I1GPM6_9GLOM|nr:galactose oxidase [Rhizophagus irregularis]CAB4414096.1 unnamed protein product [Rhizophagus irregularis]
MLKNSLVNFTLLWILLQVLVEVNCQMTPFKPSVVWCHTATLIDNKLYILGGLDLTHFDATSVKGGANNDTLFLYGGATLVQTMALVYTFDSQNITWSIPKIAGISDISKISRLSGIINHDGKIYLYSGRTANDTIVNEMLILDTINLNSGQGSLINAPTRRSHYGATLLPDNRIIYIGGMSETTISDVALPLSEVYIYDTISDSWRKEVTSGKIPSDRGGFSSILDLDGQRIIIFGGYIINTNYLDTTLYVLDLKNYNWYVPKFSGKIPSPRAYHEANVIGKYMVISFGIGYNKLVESDIYYLNKEYIWTTKFDLSVPKTSPPPSSSSSSLSPSLPLPSSSQLSDSSSNNSNSNIVGTIVGSLLSGIIFLTIGCFFIYKWNKNRQNHKTINENNNYNNYSQKEQDIHDYEQAIDNNEQEIIKMPRNHHGQEIILTPKNENTTNHEPIIVPANDYHGQEIMQTPTNGNSTNNELIITAPAVASDNNNYNYGQEIISTSNNDRLSSQILKDEILQAVKQEIAQTLKNELQAVRDNNFDITKKK